MKEKLINGLNLLLVADVFFILFAFFWFAIAVIGRSMNLNLGLDIWQQLWEPLFNPALGLFMGGALLSGIISWISKRFPAKE
ncbi:MAG: hypothetical protein Fur0025_05050 [Oscillatoriaceae cyanobacterium]|uniref:hypothetical protein n=1 Tax=[Phormidium] sp. ETS-05 TaxID=222819 RepID=UPI0018EECAAB|nr:hypothetical protein [[Phormidium] sp. ETS-05]